MTLAEHDYAAIYAAGFIHGALLNTDAGVAARYEGEPAAATNVLEMWLNDPLSDAKPMGFLITVESI